jgi:hypothetical protein
VRIDEVAQRYEVLDYRTFGPEDLTNPFLTSVVAVMVILDGKPRVLTLKSSGWTSNRDWKALSRGSLKIAAAVLAANRAASWAQNDAEARYLTSHLQAKIAEWLDTEADFARWLHRPREGYYDVESGRLYFGGLIHAF